MRCCVPLGAMSSDGKRVTFVHHREPGSVGPSAREIVDRLEHAGHSVRPLDPKTGHDSGLGRESDVVVAAGGDGTLLGVARRLAHGDTPMTVLPIGTANNLARSIGIGPDVDMLLDVLASPRERALDLGLATGSWGAFTFAESAGVGWFCDALDGLLDSTDKPLDRARGKLASFLERYEPRHWSVTIDGEDASGRYAFVDVMNARMIGPNLCLAPRADPFDGWLDVVLAAPDDRARVLRYVEGLRDDPRRAPPALDVRRAKHVRFALGGGERVRVDGATTSGPSPFLDIRVLPGAVRLWLPQS